MFRISEPMNSAEHILTPRRSTGLAILSLTLALTYGAHALLEPAPAIAQSPQVKSNDRAENATTNNYGGNLDPQPLRREFDFGYVPIDYKMIYRLNIKNLATTASDTLKILKLKSSCECTAPSIDRRLIEPGGQAEMLISFDTKTFYGPQNRFVEIHSSDPQKPELVTSFKASVGGRPAEVDMLPRSILNLSASSVDTLKVKNFTSKDIPFTVVYQDTALYRIEIPSQTVPGDGYAELYVHPAPNLKGGAFLSTLTIEFQTGDTGKEPGESRRISTPIKLVRY